MIIKYGGSNVSHVNRNLKTNHINIEKLIIIIIVEIKGVGISYHIRWSVKIINIVCLNSIPIIIYIRNENIYNEYAVASYKYFTD